MYPNRIELLFGRFQNNGPIRAQAGPACVLHWQAAANMLCRSILKALSKSSPRSCWRRRQPRPLLRERVKKLFALSASTMRRPSTTQRDSGFSTYTSLPAAGKKLISGLANLVTGQSTYP
jgi:hypothetical protein